MGMNNIKTVYMNMQPPLFYITPWSQKLTQLVGLKSSMATNAKPRGEWFPQKSGYIKIYTLNGLTMTDMAKRVH